MPKNKKYYRHPKRKTLQGKYRVKNPKKYIGDYNNVIYRSSWELKMMVYCDTSNEILRWNSEEIVVPYINPFDGRYHRYFTDFYVEKLDKKGNLKKFLCEVKPKAQVLAPKRPKRITETYINNLKTHAINQAKWKYADKYAKERGMEFTVLTEKELGIKY